MGCVRRYRTHARCLYTTTEQALSQMIRVVSLVCLVEPVLQFDFGRGVDVEPSDIRFTGEQVR
jgi:hypothetical protein